MSRRHLTFAVAAIASLVITACGSNPTAPESGVRAPSVKNASVLVPTTDTTARSGWVGSSG